MLGKRHNGESPSSPPVRSPREQRDLVPLPSLTPPGPACGLQGRADLGDNSLQPTPFSVMGTPSVKVEVTVDVTVAPQKPNRWIIWPPFPHHRDNTLSAYRTYPELYMQPHWSKNLFLCHAAYIELLLSCLFCGQASQGNQGQRRWHHLTCNIWQKRKKWQDPPWKLLVCNVVDLRDHTDLKSKAIKEQVRKYITRESSLLSTRPQNCLRHHYKCSLGLKFLSCKWASLPKQNPARDLLKLPSDKGFSRWLFWAADTFAYRIKEDDKPGNKFTLVKCNQLQQHHFWLSLWQTKVSGPRLEPRCSDAQDIHYPLANVFFKHSLIRHFVIVLWTYSIITDDSFQLKETVRGSEIVFIIQEILKTNKRILNTNTTAKVNAWKITIMKSIIDNFRNNVHA